MTPNRVGVSKKRRLVTVGGRVFNINNMNVFLHKNLIAIRVFIRINHYKVITREIGSLFYARAIRSGCSFNIDNASISTHRAKC